MGFFLVAIYELEIYLKSKRMLNFIVCKVMEKVWTCSDMEKAIGINDSNGFFMYAASS